MSTKECSASGTHQLVGEREELVKLEATYANLVIRKKIRTLSLAYPQWRSIRGDGNCFYRALWVGLVEDAVGRGGDPVEALRGRFQTAEATLQASAAPALTEEDSWRQVRQHFAKEEAEKKTGTREWARWYEDSETSDMFVRYLRSLTSRSLEQRRDELAVFLPEGQALADRRALAERMGEEAEQLEMSALLATLDVGVRVYQLDRSEGPFAVYILPDERFKGRGELVTLLYRPGHYDLLYKRA